MPITFIHGEPTMPVTINGHLLNMLLDTGGAVSILTPAALAKINGTKADILPLTARGFNGVTQMVPTFAKPFHLGDLTVEGKAFWVTPIFNRSADMPIDGIIGEDVIEQWNIDLNFPKATMALYEKGHPCSAQPPGGGSFAQEKFTQSPEHAPLFPFYINDKEFSAILDSGAETITVSAEALRNSGVQPTKTLGTAASVGVGGIIGKLTIEQFDDVTIGSEDFGTSALPVASSSVFNYNPSPIEGSKVDALIGENYLRDHEVYIANETNTIWLGTRVTSAP